MKKKGLYNLFSALCLILCAVPLVCMAFARTDASIENRTPAEWPSLTNEGKLNTRVLGEAGDYFNDHYAFRQYLVSSDAGIQSRIFSVSNVDTVIRGGDGWLYYTDTLSDYAGRTLSPRQIKGIAHNLKLAQDYAEDQGAQFLLAIPPNKNTLYGEHMPYYDSRKVSGTSNLELLAPQLKEQKISRVNLLKLFRKQDDVLYLKRDSHWDNRGARLVYDAMLDKLGKEHRDFNSTPAVRTKTEIGDLGRMLFPVTAEPEWNVYYDLPEAYKYTTDFTSVEDALIDTKNKSQTDSLLMYRDSFGNTLIPFAAEAFKNARFSKMVPHNLAADMEETKPDYVIFEKVERNLDEFLTNPPVIPVPAVKLKGKVSAAPADAKAKKSAGTGAQISVSEAEADMSFLLFTGAVPENVPENAELFLRLKTDKGTKTYEVFWTVADGADGWAAYLPKEAVSGTHVKAQIIMRQDGGLQRIGSAKLKMPANP